jgi:flagellar biosynthesis protein FlhB
LLRDGLSPQIRMTTTVADVTSLLTAICERLLLTAVPILLIVIAVAALANLIQTGFLWVPRALTARFERVDPSRGLSRWLSMDSWVGLGWAITKLMVLVAASGAFARMRLSSAGRLIQAEPPELLSLFARLLCELGLLLSLTLVGLALLDYGYQFWRHERTLMMTVEELRREQREAEGDPRLKRARRDLAFARTAVQEAHSAERVRSV